MKILFIGDIMGRIGRKTIKKLLPKIKKSHKPDLVIANAENSAHGVGVTESILSELQNYGVDFFSNGDHAFSQTKKLECYENFPIVRPANYPPGVPGKEFSIIKTKKGNILFVNLMGRTYIKKDFDCPFRKIDEILAKTNLNKEKISAIMIDIHAEATSEKIALKHYLDGRISALVGTHTHVQTADEEITEKETAYITDVGMVGFRDGCIGLAKEGIIETFKTQIKNPHILPEKGRVILNAVLININDKNGKAKSIKRITKFTNIK